MYREDVKPQSRMLSSGREGMQVGEERGGALKGAVGSRWAGQLEPDGKGGDGASHTRQGFVVQN